ncbi:MAG TPA: DUF1801 domain-containing protein [Candidatus Binatia bacterium]|nr:DUF1801 domain-containing protein [Candidatus Binatia bacterium]
MTPDERVDAYLANLPREQREVLEQLRADLARLAPEAVKTISYGMPALKLDGRFLLSYAGWKRHCSIYPIDDALLKRHAAAVGDYGRTSGALHFSRERPLPRELLEDFVRGRIEAVRREGRGARRPDRSLGTA